MYQCRFGLALHPTSLSFRGAAPSHTKSASPVTNIGLFKERCPTDIISRFAANIFQENPNCPYD